MIIVNNLITQHTAVLFARAHSQTELKLSVDVCAISEVS